MKRDKKYYMKMLLGMISIVFSSIGMFLWSFYLPTPIIESGIAYYTIHGEVYNLYIYSHGIFLCYMAQILIYVFFGYIFISIMLMFMVWATDGEIEYINVYVLRKCGSITLYMDDRKIDDKSLNCWKDRGLGKLDTWILSDMEYYIKKFDVSHPCFTANLLTADLGDESFVRRHQLPLIIMGIVVSLIITALLLPIGMLEFLNTPW